MTGGVRGPETRGAAPVNGAAPRDGLQNAI